ncbi:FxsA family protein [Sessilibacter corallicola]|uniref:FxsA family protein n=1 Tax=Sessilibacter corallicola TaxID=2904075 RepID=A0ABQ0A685_9GAMM
MPLILLFIVSAFITELWVLIQIGDEIGALSTVAATLLTAIIGIALVKRQGLKTLVRAQEKMAQGESPAKEVFEGIALFLAGIFLLIPGFVSDSLGIVLLIPGVRGALAGFILRKFGALSGDRFSAHSRYRQGNTYEGEFSHQDHNKSDKDEKNQNFLP